MTVSERERELAQFPADNLVTPKSFYPSEVPVKHPQLRHLVSVTRGDQAFYVNNHDIYVLDLQSRQRCLLATVSFDARCLAADHGWVCVGGESNGDCAFIRLETREPMPTCFGHDLDVQALGGEIVNSMNIHLLRESADAEPEPVVLISNNDRTVKIYSLVQRKVLITLEHVKPMNYAAISPDSTILAAVGDSDRVYFYERGKLPGGDGLPFPVFAWRLLAVPTVPTGPDVYDDYAFAVAFSPSGRLCAASSQGGAITVFDMNVLLNPDHEPKHAILCTFRSSRPSLWGCVRSMVFSPPPWDLLAWAEDHGRIGIADVRQSFIRRQTVYLDRCKTEHVDVQDSTPSGLKDLTTKEKLKEQHLARLRSMREAVPALNRSNSLLSTTRSELDQAMRRRQHLRQDLLSYHQGLGLDARERSVLEALETPMDHVEHRTQPYSVNYAPFPYVRLNQLAESAGMPNDHDAQLLNPGNRHAPRVHQPRRRTSVVLSESSSTRHLAPPEITRTRISESPGRMTEDELLPASTHDPAPARDPSRTQLMSYPIPSVEPWDIIQSALESARQTDASRSSPTDQPVTLAQIEAALEAERALGDQLERQLSDERQLSHLLRRQLETQEQFLQSRQREIDADPEDDADADADADAREPSLEQLLHRDLRSEQQFGEQRSQDLEVEMRLGNNRALRLYLERARLLQAPTGGTQAAPSPQAVSAQTTTLPTTNTTLHPSDVERPATVGTLQQHEEHRRQRQAWIENLERQVRRAESRVAVAAAEIRTLQAALQRNDASERGGPQTRATRRSSIGLATGPERNDRTRQMINVLRQQARRQVLESRSTTTTSSSSTSAPRPRPRPRSNRESHLMFIQSASLRDADSNGNWVGTGQLFMIYNQGRAQAADPHPAGATTRNSRPGDPAEMEIGTTGITWSADGRRLFCGTEQGIFEYTVNIHDRMQFPSLELR